MNTILMQPPSELTEALPTPPVPANVDMTQLREELGEVAHEALEARMAGIPLDRAVRDPQFPAMLEFHQGLRDALFVELPRELHTWVEDLQSPERARAAGIPSFFGQLFDRAHDSPLARPETDASADGPSQLQAALAELLLFETVRLRLLMAAWSSPEFESLGGSESDVDEIAWGEVAFLLQEPELADPDVRPIAVMVASASVALAREAAGRAAALRRVGEDTRSELRMQARLREALRELRLPESVLLENALANMLGEERLELPDLQANRPVALAGLSRQAMDQRVSRGRRALHKAQEQWPRRRKPSLYDMLREDDDTTA